MDVNVLRVDDANPCPFIDRQLHLADGTGYFDTTWAGWSAVVNRSAAPDAIWFSQLFHTLLRRLIACVEDEAMCLHDCRWADIFAVRPIAGAGCRAGRA